MLLGQSPYRRQYLESGTRFYVSLTEQLDFWKDHTYGRTARATWEKSRTGQHFACAIRGAGEFGDWARGNHHRGSERAAFFRRSASVAASKQPIEGEVIKAKPARKLHHMETSRHFQPH